MVRQINPAFCGAKVLRRRADTDYVLNRDPLIGDAWHCSRIEKIGNQAGGVLCLFSLGEKNLKRGIFPVFFALL